MKRFSSTRRRFLKQSAIAIAVPTIIPSKVLGRNGNVAPSEKIVLGGIGIGSRGSYVLSAMCAEPDVQFVAVSDIRASRRKYIKHITDEKYGNRDCATYRDMHELLARRDIDAVLIATGDRWHALGSIIAAKAGKDVYSEKPCGITMAQSQAVADTMKRYGRVFQVGTQRRSISNFQIACEMARSGKLGKLHTLYASIYRPVFNDAWLPAEVLPSVEEVDWDRWLGPCPWRPYNQVYVNGGWRGHADFDAGWSLLDWGAHTVDLCQMANDTDETTPVEFTPHNDKITAMYANGVKLVMDFLVDPFGDRSPHFRTEMGTCPVRFEGDLGWVETGDNGAIESHPASIKAQLATIKRSGAGTDPDSHVRNFFDCVKSRALTAANPEVMRQSHIACYCAAISWRLGRKLKFDPMKNEFIGDDEANRMRSGAMRTPWHI